MSSRKRSIRLNPTDVPDNRQDDPDWPSQTAPEDADVDNAAFKLSLDDLQLEVALYIESVSAELSAMARESRLEGLGYFLEMARIEASIQVERRALDQRAGQQQL